MRLNVEQSALIGGQHSGFHANAQRANNVPEVGTDYFNNTAHVLLLRCLFAKRRCA